MTVVFATKKNKTKKQNIVQAVQIRRAVQLVLLQTPETHSD